MEQRVSRADLRSPESTSEPESDDDVIKRLKQMTNVEYIERDEVDAGKLATQQGDEDEQLEFQLFATSKPESNPANRIRLRSPTPATGEPGFISAKRDVSRFLTDVPSLERRREIELSVVSGEDILARSSGRHTGSEYAWKVLHIPLPGQALLKSSITASTWQKLVKDEGSKKRTRPGKKYRIKIRTRSAAIRAKREASKAATESKDVAEREKRNRRNREKKIKRREKERAKKAAKTNAAGADEQDAAVVPDDESE